jgi:hypothetical protein
VPSKQKFLIASLSVTLVAIALPQLGQAQESDEARKARLRQERNERILSREEIEKAIAPHVPAIQTCYKTHAAEQETAKGDLRLEMLIHPKGKIQKLWVVAPGVKGKKLDKCIKDLSQSWRFPEKPGFTNAVLPFSFVKTHAKGAGPLHSCWSAKGCPDKTRQRRQKKKK